MQFIMGDDQVPIPSKSITGVFIHIFFELFVGYVTLFGHYASWTLIDF
jgi:hypothetical protein